MSFQRNRIPPNGVRKRNSIFGSVWRLRVRRPQFSLGEVDRDGGFVQEWGRPQNDNFIGENEDKQLDFRVFQHFGNKK